MNFKIPTFIFAIAFSASANASNEELLFECSLPPLKLGVYAEEGGGYYSDKQVKIEKYGDIEFVKTYMDYQGSGDCRYSIWSFEFNESSYSVESMGCNHPSIKVPENAKGMIRVHDQEFWCY
jgi:hypothetical protein